MVNYDDLIQFASVRQVEYIDAIKKFGSHRKAAKHLGVDSTTIDSAIKSLKNKAASKGHSPEHDMIHTVPDGYLVKGVSTLYDSDGVKKIQWVKSTVDSERQAEIMKATIAALSEEVRGLSPKINKINKSNSELLVVYPFGDPHFGMQAWAKECGENFDLKEARRVTLGAVDRLLSVSPNSETAILLPLGDIYHVNDQTNTTPGHKNQLDADSRFVHILQIGIETFRYCILRALQKHNKVIVRFVSGNHDPQAVWALAFTIAAYFDNEPRVSVDLSPAKCWYYKFGNNLIGSTHGDLTKPEQLLGVMASDQAVNWGLTKHRTWLCGHVHHSSVKEYPGVTVETFRTLAAADAYAAGHGYRAGRDMRSIVYDKEHGEIERHRCDIGMINDFLE